MILVATEVLTAAVPYVVAAVLSAPRHHVFGVALLRHDLGPASLNRAVLDQEDAAPFGSLSRWGCVLF